MTSDELFALADLVDDMLVGYAATCAVAEYLYRHRSESANATGARCAVLGLVAIIPLCIPIDAPRLCALTVRDACARQSDHAEAHRVPPPLAFMAGHPCARVKLLRYCLAYNIAETCGFEAVSRAKHAADQQMESEIDRLSHRHVAFVDALYDASTGPQLLAEWIALGPNLAVSRMMFNRWATHASFVVGAQRGARASRPPNRNPAELPDSLVTVCRPAARGVLIVTGARLAILRTSDAQIVNLVRERFGDRAADIGMSSPAAEAYAAAFSSEFIDAQPCVSDARTDLARAIIRGERSRVAITELVGRMLRGTESLALPSVII